MKHILFDLDGTLLDFNKGEKKAFIETMKTINYDPSIDDMILFSDINEKCFLEYQNNILTRPEFHHKRFTLLLDKLNLKSDPDVLNKYYVDTLKYCAEMYDDVIDIIKYLSNKYDLYIASNGMSLVQSKRMEVSGLDKYFKKYYISEDVKYNKPDIEFFEYIYNDIKDLDKSNYIMIGDRLDTDILGGNNIGFITIYIDRFGFTNDNIKPNIIIKSLNELKDIL